MGLKRGMAAPRF